LDMKIFERSHKLIQMKKPGTNRVFSYYDLRKNY
jgi:hypothetical protein